MSLLLASALEDTISHGARPESENESLDCCKSLYHLLRGVVSRSLYIEGYQTMSRSVFNLSWLDCDPFTPVSSTKLSPSLDHAYGISSHGLSCPISIVQWSNISFLVVIRLIPCPSRISFPGFGKSGPGSDIAGYQEEAWVYTSLGSYDKWRIRANPMKWNAVSFLRKTSVVCLTKNVSVLLHTTHYLSTLRSQMFQTQTSFWSTKKGRRPIIVLVLPGQRYLRAAWWYSAFYKYHICLTQSWGTALSKLKATSFSHRNRISTMSQADCAQSVAGS